MKNKKLRLLVTKECHNNCPKCCNKLYDLDSIPIIDRFDYDEVCITGGEPMLDLPKVVKIAEMFKTAATVLGKEVKVYLYTARITNGQLNLMMMCRVRWYLRYSAFGRGHHLFQGSQYPDA